MQPFRESLLTHATGTIPSHKTQRNVVEEVQKLFREMRGKNGVRPEGVVGIVREENRKWDSEITRCEGGKGVRNTGEAID